MRWNRGALLLSIGVAACATPGQVRQVQTQVEAAKVDQARADSAQRAEQARTQIALRQYNDSVMAMISRLNDAIQHANSTNAANMDNLREQLYQLSNLSSTTRAALSTLSSRVNEAVASGAPAPPPPPAGSAAADSTHPQAVQIPQPDELLTQARNFLYRSAYVAARKALTTLLESYPQAPQVTDATLLMGQSYDPTEPDSARVYYTKVYKSYPDTPAAPTALFKLGNLELSAGSVPTARRFWQMVVDKYKDSLEFASAQQRLRDNP